MKEKPRMRPNKTDEALEAMRESVRGIPVDYTLVAATVLLLDTMQQTGVSLDSVIGALTRSWKYRQEGGTNE